MNVVEELKEAFKEMNLKVYYSQEGNFFIVPFKLKTKSGEKEVKIFVEISENWILTFGLLEEVDNIPPSMRPHLYEDLLEKTLYGREIKYSLIEIDKEYIAAQAETRRQAFSREDFKVEFKGVLAAALIFYDEILPKHYSLDKTI
ncbi:MAG: hypothetical protein DRJ35_05000 [Thermoprotei archaeon]|nr:MAG: hypothetical protein DRJ35_05000 [Thermoprotei archaeon]